MDLCNLQPTTITRDLKGKYMLFYSAPKMGKTSLAAKFPKSLILAFEKGYNDLSGIFALDIPKWTVMREVLRELRKPEVQDRYDTIVFDTATIAWDKVCEFICSQKDVDELNEIPWGGGHTLAKKEFQNVLREISMLGYGIVFTAHSEEKQIPGGKDGDTFVCPMLEKRAYAIINGMVDIIGYIGIKDGKRFLQTRATPRCVAGTRFEFLPPVIPFSYEALTEELAKAIEKKGQMNPKLFVDTDKRTVEKTRPFSEAMEEAKEIWLTFAHRQDEKSTLKILEILKNNFGEPKKFSDIKESQLDLLELTIKDIREELGHLL